MRRRVAIAGYFSLIVLLAVVLGSASACMPARSEPTTPEALGPRDAPPSSPANPTVSYYIPQGENWEIPRDAPTGRVASNEGSVEIEGLGSFTFDPADVETLRPDIFWQGHFSVFDVVAHLADKGWFTMNYHYERCLDTYVIEDINGQMNWWYRAHYSGGWYEVNAHRMDMYPYKDGTQLRLSRQSEEYLGRIYNSFAEEIVRKSFNLERVVIPEVRVGSTTYPNVPVSAHNVRNDVLQPGTLTALDVLLSLADQKRIRQMKLTWYGSIGDADPVDNYWVEQIDDGDGLFDEEASSPTSGWVYETGSRSFPGFQGSHICIPADVRPLVSPEYMMWYWPG